MTGYRPRALGGIVREALEDMPVVVVTGLRQAGKSTFLQNEAVLRTRRYVSLDDVAQLEAARRDPDAFLHGEGTLSVDEAQKCPEILTAIKRVVDRDRRPGRFLLTGSANFGLLKGVAESLAGRAVYLPLHPFTRRELDGKVDGAPFLKRLFDSGEAERAKAIGGLVASDVLRGGLPPVCLGLVKNAELWFRGYEQTYLERDVRDLSRLVDLISFRQILRLAALRSARVLKTSEIARDAKLNAATASRYLSVLEASFVISRLPPFLSNRASRLIKSPKLLFTDSGLGAYLAGVGPGIFETGDPLGSALLETYVAQNLAGLLAAHWPAARLCYWHVQGRYEVDFVIEAGRDSMALELKSAGRWDERDLSGLEAFLKATPRCRAAVLLYGGSEVVPIGKRMWAVPTDLALS